MTSPPPPELKERLRSEGFTRRDGLDKEFRHEAAQRIAAQAFKFSDLQDVTPVGGYWPIRTEVDPRPLMEALLERGQDVALSQILHPHLSWRLWQPGDVLVVNDPYMTAGQLLDVTTLTPVWRNDEIIAYVGSTIHHTDVGGYGIGACARATASMQGPNAEQVNRIASAEVAAA